MYWCRKSFAMLALLPPSSCLRLTMEPRIAQASSCELHRISLVKTLTYGCRKPLCCSCSLFQVTTTRFFDLSLLPQHKTILSLLSATLHLVRCLIVYATLCFQSIVVLFLIFSLSIQQDPRWIRAFSHLPAHQHNSVPKICHLP